VSIRYSVVCWAVALIPIVACQGPVRPSGVVASADAASKPAHAASIVREAPSNSDRQDGIEKDAAAFSESKQDDWQRRKDCAAQADRVMRDTGLTGDRNVIGWENHYNPKYGRCFVLVDYINPDAEKIPGIPSFYNELYDAFERRLLSTCQDDLDKNTFCTVQSEGSLGAVDCRVCRSLVKDRMEE
jgi:hypothetical protein